MSRRRRVIHKEEKLDGRYHSPVVARLISTVMQDGKKSLAERIVYTAIEETRTGRTNVHAVMHLACTQCHISPAEALSARRTVNLIADRVRAEKSTAASRGA